MGSEILVRGEGEASALPDRAVLQVTIDGEGSTQEVAYGEAAKSARAIDAVIENYSDAIVKHTTTALAVLPKTRWRKGESIRTGYRASRVTVLEVQDLTRLGGLIADLAAASPTAIHGPRWELNPDNDVHRIARQNAIADGRRRASAYAEALGVTIKGVKWVAEPGLRFSHDEYISLSRSAGAAGTARGHAAEEPIDVGPEEIRVHAVVEMGFENTE